jgi:hypothetical protein
LFALRLNPNALGLEGVKWIGLSIFGVLEHYNLINNLAKIKKNIIMLSIRYRPPFWNITRNNGTLHEIKGLQGVLGCFAKTKKNIIMLSMTYKNKNDYITKPVILGITSAESICGIPRKSKIVFLEHWNIVTLSKTYTKKNGTL